jgi:hypothetical protein
MLPDISEYTNIRFVVGDFLLLTGNGDYLPTQSNQGI